MVSYGGHTVSAVSCSTVLSEVIFLLEVIQLGHNSEKVLGFGPLHFDPRGHFDFFSQIGRSLGDRDPSPSLPRRALGANCLQMAQAGAKHTC